MALQLPFLDNFRRFRNKSKIDILEILFRQKVVQKGRGINDYRFNDYKLKAFILINDYKGILLFLFRTGIRSTMEYFERIAD